MFNEVGNYSIGRMAMIEEDEWIKAFDLIPGLWKLKCKQGLSQAYLEGHLQANSYSLISQNMDIYRLNQKRCLICGLSEKNWDLYQLLLKLNQW